MSTPTMPPIAPIAELLAITDSAAPPADFAAVALRSRQTPAAQQR